LRKILRRNEKDMLQTQSQKCSKALKISAMRMGGGKISPRILRVLTALALCCIISACTHPKPTTSSLPIDPQAVYFQNHDTFMTYAERAFLEDDPQGLYVVGAAYYLSQAELLPDYIHVVPREQADEFLDISAAMGYSPAVTLIAYLQAQGLWEW